MKNKYSCFQKLIVFFESFLAEFGYLKNKKRIKDMLQEIDKLYCVKFKTFHKLTFNDRQNTCCFLDEKKININLCDIKTSNHINSLFKFKSDKEKMIYSLLHEFYHSIDKQFNKKSFTSVNMSYYYHSTKYHDNISFEKRANDFAKKEIIKWKKYNNENK